MDKTTLNFTAPSGNVCEIITKTTLVLGKRRIAMEGQWKSDPTKEDVAALSIRIHLFIEKIAEMAGQHLEVGMMGVSSEEDKRKAEALVSNHLFGGSNN